MRFEIAAKAVCGMEAMSSGLNPNNAKHQKKIDEYIENNWQAMQTKIECDYEKYMLWQKERWNV